MFALSTARPGRLPLLRLLGIVLLTSLSCGGGGSPSPTAPNRPPCDFAEPPPGFPDRTSSFAPAASTAPSITLEPGPNCVDLLVLEIRANGVDNLRGIRFDFDEPDGLLQFDALQVGPFLTGNGAVQVTPMTGELMRPADAGGVSGSGRIALVAWVYDGPSGTGELRFTGEAVDSDGNVVGTVEFAGGTVTVN